MPACASTSSTGWVSANRLAVYATVSRTVRSLSRPPVCMTAETSPRAMACLGRRPSTSTVPCGRLRQAEQHVDGRGLAGAVGAEEGDDLALLDLQVDAAHGLHGAEVLGEPGDADRGGGRSTSGALGVSLVRERW